MKKLLFLILIFSSCSPGRWSLNESNDYFKPTGNVDTEFTQGLRLQKTIKDSTGSHSYYGGQNILTPSHKQISEPILDDRPYAAFLYGGYDANYSKDEDTQDTVGIIVGVVGPLALGKQSQNNIHNLIDIPRAQGWSNQLDNELGLMVTLERKQINAKYFIGELQFDHMLLGGVNLGNVMTQGYVGNLIRLGKNPRSVFDISEITARSSLDHESTPVSYYGFLGLKGRAIARNIFLDGNTFSESQSVNKEPFVGEVFGGVNFTYGNTGITYTLTHITSEYEERGRGNTFGSLSFDWSW